MVCAPERMLQLLIVPPLIDQNEHETGTPLRGRQRTEHCRAVYRGPYHISRTQPMAVPQDRFASILNLVNAEEWE